MQAVDDVPIWHLAVLALVQGVTEFLPISSSAHLILVPYMTGWTDQGLAIDVAMHIGTLLAVLVYFRRDVARLAVGTLNFRSGSEDARLAGQLVLATLPVVAAGYVLYDQIATQWRSVPLIVLTTAAFGLLLWAADRRAQSNAGGLPGLGWGQAAVIGLAQALALVPGVSRSGITMTAGLFAGLSRTEAARFSLLLSIPTTAAAGLLATVELVRSHDAAMQANALFAGALAFASALAAVTLLMRWLRRATFTPFVIYRLALAALLAGMLLLGFLPSG
ncbi:MAG: undecaprenyl-diphosphate phosphatase [Alphaproteobacteria bacterium]